MNVDWFSALAGGDVTQFLVVGSISAAIFGMGKVGFGGGVGILATSVMILATGEAKLATGVILPLLICADWFGVAAWYRQWDFRAFRMVLPGVALGIAAAGGLIALSRHLGMDDKGGYGEILMKLAVGLISLAFTVLYVLRTFCHRHWAFRPVFWQASVAGSLIGLTSTFAHAAGPVSTMYLLGQDMAKKRFVATTVLLFYIVNHLKLVPYALLGLIRGDTLLLGLWLVPAVLAGAILGKILNRLIPDVKFTGIVYTLLALTGAHFTYTSLRALLG